MEEPMKHIKLILVLIVLVSMACNFGKPAPTAETPTDAAPPVQEPATAEQPAPGTPETSLPTTFSGLEQTCGDVSLTLPQTLASAIECQIMPPQSGDTIAPWEVTPGHVEIGLTGYTLSDKFHHPRLYIYPAINLVALQPFVAENIQRIQGILGNPSASFSKDDLPAIHFFNAGKVFASNIAVINFQTGSGVRALNVFGQYYAPVNNTELFYHFQGLTQDGQFYIIAILPVTHPGLQANSQEGSMPASAEFPAYPSFSSSNLDDEMATYYEAMTNLLNAAPAEAFNPPLTTLDLLIQSIKISP
jgi:hypothetical protein